MDHDLIKHFTDETFDAEVASGLVLVDFYADWCGPCRMLTPVLVELAKEMKGRLVVAKVDTDQSVHVASKFEVTSIPTLILLKDGKLVARSVGLKDLEALRKMVSSAA